MKKKFLRVLSFFMVLCLLFSNVSHAECSHDWDFEYDPLSVYESIDETYHIMVATELYYICTECDERRQETQTVEGASPSEHRYSPEGVCYTCEYERVIAVTPTATPTATPTVEPTSIPTPAPTVHVCIFENSHWYQNDEYYNEEKHSYRHLITPICTMCGQKGEKTNKLEYGKHKIEDGVCTKCEVKIGLSEAEKKYIQEQINELSELLNVVIKLKEMGKISTSHCAAIAQIISNKISEYNEARDGIKDLAQIALWTEISELKEISERRIEVENYTYEVDEQTVTINLEKPDNEWYYIIGDAGEQIIFGNFSEKVTLLGIAGQVFIGEIPYIATIADVRDLLADVKYWEDTSEHKLNTTLDLLAVIPVLGSIKYLDKASVVLRGFRIFDKQGELYKVTKGLGKIIDARKHSDEIASAVEKVIIKNADEVADATTVVIKNLDDLKAAVKNPDIFNENALEHIFKGNKTGGFHYEGLEDAVGEVIEVTRKPNAQGVYEVAVQIGKNTKTSTFFPKDWTPEQVLEAIEEAYNNRVFKNGNTYEAKIESGITIRMYIEYDGTIKSAFPLYE